MPDPRSLPDDRPNVGSQPIEEEIQALQGEEMPGDQDAVLSPDEVEGDREAWAVIDGVLDRNAAIAEDARRNLSFAKRQRTWFRTEPDITWLDATGGPTFDETLTAARRLLTGWH